MADMSFGLTGSGEDYVQGRPGGYVNMLAAVTSLALLAGAGWWGFQLAVRDVSGIPVVRALKGPMREAPADPGGDFAANQGLSVNRIASEGTAAPPVDELILAPRPVDLESSDTAGTLALGVPTDPDPSATPASVSKPAPQRDAIADAVSVALEGADMTVLANALAGDTPSLEDPADDVTGDAATDIDMTAAKGAIARSPRPMPRPDDTVGQVEITAITPTSGAFDVPETDGGDLASGTRLVQLGAFDSVSTARTEWGRLAGRFGDLLQGKARIVQPVKSGEREFYRLRAQGFADEPDQRRFCAALLAEHAACIPVTMR